MAISYASPGCTPLSLKRNSAASPSDRLEDDCFRSSACHFPVFAFQRKISAAGRGVPGTGDGLGASVAVGFAVAVAAGVAGTTVGRAVGEAVGRLVGVVVALTMGPPSLSPVPATR